MQLRAVAIGRETTIAAPRDEVQGLQARASPTQGRAPNWRAARKTIWTLIPYPPA